MDRNNRVGRRERFEILKIAQGLGAGTVAVDKGSLRPFRPNTILLAALEESIARRTREGRIWPAFLAQFLDWATGRWDRCRPGRRSAAFGVIVAKLASCCTKLTETALLT